MVVVTSTMVSVVLPGEVVVGIGVEPTGFLVVVTVSVVVFDITVVVIPVVE